MAGNVFIRDSHLWSGCLFEVSGCLSNQSLSQALAFKKKKKKKEEGEEKNKTHTNVKARSRVAEEEVTEQG